jgi:hemerythrin-like domain-containing protein
MKRTSIFERMRDDHRRVLERVAALENGVLGPAYRRGRALGERHLEELRDVVELLKRQFATHMAAEDEVLFPALVEALPQTKATLEPLHAEHADLDRMLVRLDATLREPRGAARDVEIGVQVRDLVDLLRIHIRKEEAVVLSVAERVLKPQEVESLERRMQSRMQATPTPVPNTGRTKGSRQ